MAYETWPGGFVHVDAQRRKTYVIRKRIGGIRFKVSTRCSSLRAAMTELERFEKDPIAYRAGGASDAPVYLATELVQRFLEASKAKGTSKPWRARQRNVLAWWGDELKGIDLRRATLRHHLLPALEKVPGKPPRIAIIKALYSWLRETDQLALGEDPTFGKLRVPQAQPEQHRRSKAIPKKDYEKVRKKLAIHYRDALDVLAACGWHVTELERFARAGEVLDYKGDDAGAVAVLVTTHKVGGAAHRTAVTTAVAKAARRIREREGISISRFHRAVLEACATTKVTAFGPGQMRHTVATWAIEKGSDPAAVAAYLGHRSPATTKRFYATLAVPPRVPALR